MKISSKKKLFWRSSFFGLQQTDSFRNFLQVFDSKFFTWDPKFQFRRSKWPWEKIVWILASDGANFSLSKTRKWAKQVFSFKNIPVTQRSLVFTWSFFSSNSRVGEKSRESSFLLHRTTKLKNTDSISVPSFFFFFAYCVRKKVPRNSTKYFFLQFIKDFVVRIWDKIVHFSETRRVNFGTKYLEFCSDFVQHILFHEENVKKVLKI